MKTKLLIALFIFQSYGSYSQQKVDYSILAGINFNKAETNFSNDNLNTLLGINGALQLQYHFNEKFSIKNRVQINQKGFKFKDLLIEYPDMSIGRADLLMRFDYVDIKVLPSLNFGNKAKISTYFGPSLGFLTESSLVTKYKEGSLNGTQNNNSTGSEYRKNINLGMTVGMSSRFSLSSKLSLSFDVLYDHGFTNVIKNGKTKLRTVSISPGLIFTP